jgi:hypothetical protein
MGITEGLIIIGFGVVSAVVGIVIGVLWRMTQE